MKRVIRSEHGKHNPFAQISRRLLQDETLTMEALGVMTYLLSHSDEWKVNVTHLAKRFNCGRDRTYRVLDELLEKGYLTRKRSTNEKGQFSGIEYQIFEEPGITPKRQEHINELRTMPYNRYLKSNHWKRIRRKAYATYGNACMSCGMTSNLHIHHLTYDNRGNEKMEDLQILCADCHKKVHGIED